MVLISIGTRPSDQEYGVLREKWHSSRNAEIQLPSKVSPSDAYQWIDFLLRNIGDGFADSLLASFVELDAVTSERVLLQVLSTADKGARVSVCLKAGLSKELREVCLSDEDADVRQHALMR